jgi:hypothetical protein
MHPLREAPVRAKLPIRVNQRSTFSVSWPARRQGGEIQAGRDD